MKSKSNNHYAHKWFCNIDYSFSLTIAFSANNAAIDNLISIESLPLNVMACSIHYHNEDTFNKNNPSAVDVKHYDNL